LSKYARLFVLDWANQILRDGSLMPPFMMPFGPDLTFDLVCGRKSMFVYFDPSAFAEFVNGIADGKFMLRPGGKVDQEWSGLEIVFPDKKGRQGESMLGWGFIFRMLMEFQDPDGVRCAIVEMVQSQEKFVADIERLRAADSES
jgi:hypothetical protein